ncbi:hypothetical protein QBC44DRAFT_364311 [Cladorrhinum sp. PSN332]|nr:hypothetical protein QBC44DRAFT_364311 [Cladorrhinum sp. PSN332]
MAPTPPSPVAPNGHEGHNHYPDVSKYVNYPNLAISVMFVACLICMAMAVYQGDRGSWRQLERLKERREEARRQQMAQGQGIAIAVTSCPTAATERTPLLLVVPPPATSDFVKGLPSPALSGITEIPPLQEALPDLEEPRKGGSGESSNSQQRRFSY